MVHPFRATSRTHSNVSPKVKQPHAPGSAIQTVGKITGWWTHCVYSRAHRLARDYGGNGACSADGTALHPVPYEKPTHSRAACGLSSRVRQSAAARNASQLCSTRD